VDGPRFYRELADWWPLLSPPEDYAEEAAFYLRTLAGASSRPVRTVLELGSGGGNNASHLKAHYALTLVDVAPGMLELSRSLNPECEHHVGDMRTVRLGRRFDAVFVHDAVDYLLHLDDLLAALTTVYEHLHDDGVALVCPDHVRETFAPSTDHGGHDGRDGDDRALRYLEWTWDRAPDGTTYVTDYAYLLREGDEVRVVHDRHRCGLFPRRDWLDAFDRVGFREVEVLAGAEGHEVFRARRR
jgi:SAM-dependent methyltransferase